MPYDIKDELVKKYLEEIDFLSKTYNDDCKRFFDKVDKIIEPYLRKIKEIELEYKDDEDFCICETLEYQTIEEYNDLKYHYLSSILQSLLSLWENQIKEFYLSEPKKNFNDLKMKLKNDGYYDIDSDVALKEIIAIYNYIKHGQFGDAEATLKIMNSKYYRNDGIPGEVRGGYFRNKLLIIDIDDIQCFSNILINFWKSVNANIK